MIAFVESKLSAICVESLLQLIFVVPSTLFVYFDNSGATNARVSIQYLSTLHMYFFHQFFFVLFILYDAAHLHKIFMITYLCTHI